MIMIAWRYHCLPGKNDLCVPHKGNYRCWKEDSKGGACTWQTLEAQGMLWYTHKTIFLSKVSFVYRVECTITRKKMEQKYNTLRVYVHCMCVRVILNLSLSLWLAQSLAQSQSVVYLFPKLKIVYIFIFSICHSFFKELYLKFDLCPAVQSIS